MSVLSVLIAIDNKNLQLTEITVKSEKIPESFFGYRIAQVSDLHNTELGKDNERLLSMLRDIEPDIIVVTGDLIDSRRTDVETGARFLNDAADIAPCYYVMGNHERRVPAEYERMLELIDNGNVFVLTNEAVSLERGGEQITLVGLEDMPEESTEVSYLVDSLCEDACGYTVLLSHKPDFYREYADSKADLVFSGHAHGGQFRLPFIGGLLAPGQGLFPEYTEGASEIGDTVMIVSRGIGNSLFPFRINNRPEVVVASLWGEE